MFKRNQVEEAIVKVWGAEPASPEDLLRSQIKRLLDTDRSLGRNRGSSDSHRANYAFYSNPMLGKGYDNSFSEYEAFALLTGLRLMQQGQPQGLTVKSLRQVRPELEKEFSRIVGQDPTELFDMQRIKQAPGSLAVDNSDPVFLGIISARHGQKSAPEAVIARGQDALLANLMAHGSGFALTALEIASSVHVLDNALATIKSRSRGRSKWDRTHS